MRAARDPGEIGRHLLGRLVALGGILRQRPHDGEVEIAWDLRAMRGGGFRHRREVLHGDLHGRVATERDRPRQQLVQDDAEGIQI